MGFRDEHEAARGRIESLEAELETLREERRAKRSGEPPFAMVSVVLGLAVVFLVSTLIATWSYSMSSGREVAALQQRLAAMHDAQVREMERPAPVCPRPARPPPDPPYTQADIDRQDAWSRGDEVREEWAGTVAARTGDAPALLDQACTVTVVRPAVRTTPVFVSSRTICDVSVRCGERELVSADGEPRPMHCMLWNRYLRLTGPVEDEGPTIARDAGTFTLEGWRGHRGDPWTLRIDAQLR